MKYTISPFPNALNSHTATNKTMSLPLIESFYEKDEKGLFKTLYGGIKFYVPKMPTQGEILFSDKPIKEQYWQRHEIPTFSAKDIKWFVDEPDDYDIRVDWDTARRQEIIGQTGLDPEDLNTHGDPKPVKDIKPNPNYCIEALNDYRKREIQRTYPYKGGGVWVMIKGMAIWFPGTFYSYLQWAKNDNGYPYLKINDLLKCYHWEFVRDHRLHLGRIEVAPRGDGKSALMAWVMYIETVFNENAITSIVGRNDDDSEKFFVEKVVQQYKNLPDFLVPINDNGTNPTKKLAFSPPAKRGKNSFAHKIEQKRSINSMLVPESAGEGVLDRATRRMIAVEEPGKTKPTTARASVRHNTQKQSVWRNGVKVGNFWITGTVEEVEDGGDEFKKMWEASNPNKLTENGQTTSGVLKYMVSAYDIFVDKYGFPVRENPDEETALFLKERYGEYAMKGGIPYVDNQRRAVKDNPSEYRQIVRKFPTNEDEIFMFGTGGGHFDEGILSDVQVKLKDPDYKPTRTVRFYPQANGKIGWEDHPQGGWEVCWFPDEEVVKSNNYTSGYSMYYVDRVKQKSILPLNEFMTAGVDPVSHFVDFLDEKKRGSDNACTIRTGNHMGIPKKFRNIPVAIYRKRTNNPEDAFKEITYGLMFYGATANAESNKAEFINYLTRVGLLGLIRPKLGTEFSSSPIPGQASSGGANGLIEQYTGKIKKDVTQNGHKYKHLSLVEELFKFEPKDTKVFDLTVSFGLSLLEAKDEEEKVQETQKMDIKNLFGYR